MQEADYEIASYARQHSSMGILSQDSDFLIYDRFVKVRILLFFRFKKNAGFGIICGKTFQLK